MYDLLDRLNRLFAPRNYSLGQIGFLVACILGPLPIAGQIQSAFYGDRFSLSPYLFIFGAYLFLVPLGFLVLVRQIRFAYGLIRDRLNLYRRNTNG